MLDKTIISTHVSNINFRHKLTGLNNLFWQNYKLLLKLSFFCGGLGDSIFAASADFFHLLVYAQPRQPLLQLLAILGMVYGIEEWVEAGRCLYCQSWYHGENRGDFAKVGIRESRYEGYCDVRNPREQEEDEDAKGCLCYAHFGRRIRDGCVGPETVDVHFASLLKEK